jgi:hypothetical protein
MTSPANPCQRAQRERVLKTGLPVLKTGLSTAETLLTATTPLGQSAESPSRAQEPALPRKATAETSSFSAGFRTRGVGSTTPLTGTSATPGPCDAVADAGSLASRPLAAHSSPYFARPQQGRFPLRWNFFPPWWNPIVRAGQFAWESNSSGEGRQGVLAQGPPTKTKVAAKAMLHVSGTFSIRVGNLASGPNGRFFPQT